MFSNTKTDSFKEFKLFKNIDEKFLTTSMYKSMQQNFFTNLKKRVRQEDSYFKFKMQVWSDINEKKILFDDINDLINRQYRISVQQNKGQYFQQLFSNETPPPSKKVQSIHFVDDQIIVQYSVDNSLERLSSQQNFEKMIYQEKSSTFISQIEEEEGNVKIDYKVQNWIDNYFQEGKPETKIPDVYKVVYFNLAISLAFFYKFIKNSLY